MLTIKDLSVNYNNKIALKNISFKAKKSETIGILGKNGAGKTTLFNAIAGYVNFKGNIFFGDKGIKPNQVSYLETENYFYPYIKGSEYLNFFKETKKDTLSQLAEIFSIPLDEYVHNYSTGMKKKIAIIANYILGKPLLILDEPFNGLDFESVENLYLLINKINGSKTTILISSHILETLLNCCDKIILIEEGKIKKEYLKKDFNFIKEDIKNQLNINYNAW